VRAGRVIRGAAGGAGAGFLAPTQEGTLESHVPGAVGGGIVGLAAGALGGVFGRSEDFDRAAYRWALDPIRKYLGRYEPRTVGEAGLQELNSLINASRVQPPGGHNPQQSSDVMDAFMRMTQLNRWAEEGRLVPQRVIDSYERQRGGDVSEIIDLAKAARNSGVGTVSEMERAVRSNMLHHVQFHAVPAILAAAGWRFGPEGSWTTVWPATYLAQIAARRLLHANEPGRAVSSFVSRNAPGVAGATVRQVRENQ
jgi:hypothetical protein